MKKTSKSRAILLVVAVGLLVGLLLFMPLPTVDAWGWDVAVFRAGSKALLHGDNPYLPASIPRYADGAHLATIPYFTYAPVFAVLVAPLALLPPWLAFRVWFLINILLYFSSILLLLSAIAWRLKTSALTGLMLAFFIFAPLRTLLIIGQNGIIMLFFLSLCFWLLKRRKPAWAGAALSLAFFKPHLVLVLPYMVLRRQWRLLAGFAAATLLAALPFFMLLDDWIRTIFATHSANIQYGCMPFTSLNMFLQCALPQAGVSRWLGMGILALVLGITIWLVWAAAPVESSKFDYQLALVVVAGLLVIDNIRVADLVLLVFPLLVLLHDISLRPNSWRRRLLVGLLMAAFLIPYIGVAFAAVTKNPMWTWPVWYMGVSLSVFLALVFSISTENLTSSIEPLSEIQ